MSALDLAIQQLKSDEGYRQFLYKDTRGNITGGWGHNFTANGISENIADEMLNIDVQVADQTCQEVISNFDSLSDNRQAALIGMAFNLGRGTFGEFTTFFDLIEKEEFDQAADDLLTTAAAKELPERYGRYAEDIRNG